MGALTVRADDDLTPLPKARIKGKQNSALSFDMRAALHGVLHVHIQRFGVSLCVRWGDSGDSDLCGSGQSVRCARSQA